MAEVNSAKESEVREAYQQGQKLLYDAFKHLTTLSTGSIFILVALLEKLFKNPEWTALIAVSFVCLILSTISSFIAMILLGLSVQASGELGETGGNIGAGTFLISITTFLLGIIALVAFVFKNFY